MRLKCEIKSRDIVPTDTGASLRYMSDKTNAIAKILKKFYCEEVYVAIDPNEGFVFKFECRLSDAENIFREVQRAAVK